MAGRNEQVNEAHFYRLVGLKEPEGGFKMNHLRTIFMTLFVIGVSMIIKEAILESARTEYQGDGVVVVSPIEEATSIRTGQSILIDE